MISSTSLFIGSRLSYIVENGHLLIFHFKFLIRVLFLADLLLHAEFQNKSKDVLKANPGKYQWKFEKLDLEQWLVFLWKFWSNTCMSWRKVI